LEGLRERFLPECTFRGKQNTKLPVTVACGDLDVPFLVDRCRLFADRLPTARHHVLAGLAHQPYLESASTVAQLIRSAVTGG
jgi:pimeloyl-ACP methyl ester carboxylesterase